MNKKQLINIRFEPRQISREGGYGETITNYSKDSIVEIMDIKKQFYDDPYLHKAKKWINQTFMEHEYDNIKLEIKSKKENIKNIENDIKELNEKMNTFLVPVNIIK